MKAKKFMSLALTGVLAASLLAGCGTDKAKEGGESNQGGEKKLTIGMVTDVGGVHDNSFNQSAWEGLTRAKNELGVTPKVTESKRAEDYTPNLNGFVKDANVGMTWGIGFLMEKDIKSVALANPDAKIGIIDSDLGGDVPKNVTAVTFKEEEGSFLMGVLAGKMTKSNKVGFVGGVKFALIERFEYGFKAGVKSVNPNAVVTAVYADAFDKPDKGKLLAAQLYQSGNDIIFHASGLTGDGVFAEAKERGKGFWVIGVDRDQNDLAPANTLSSMVKRVDNAIFTITKDLNEGKFDSGHIVYGLKDDGVGYAPTTKNNTPEDVIKLMDDYKKQIIDGKIVAPATADEFKNFK
ncbi:BMP family ABC transporter substrate-binding protein [Tumebacillus algifaecis]|uniref:BMP family ABC transporter substrate-binding protein n=2 Tax=Tumebacillus algifaecis TaxID=1214604 RepID=A0A223D6L1_9BACL|nr:BMP family ABC transporter substrate-binding protein [Tumebacillus algifaecis]